MRKIPWKRLVALLLGLLIVFGTVSSLAEVRRIRTGYRVRLRATASVKGKVLDAYSVGTRVNVLSKGATWCKVRVGNKTGYMMTRYLYAGEGTSSDDTGVSGGSTMKVWTPSGTTLNLRSEPSVFSETIGSYKVGTRVTVLKRGSSWTKVRVGGKVGYMGSQYLVK